MLVLFWILTLVGFGVAAAVGWHRRRRQARLFQWQFGTYDGGRLVHAVPIGDGIHIEDHPSDCHCCPWTERFVRGDGSYGRVVYHQRRHR